MSLLLDALKKAEKAKEEAQRRAQGEGAGEPRTETGTAEETRHVRTRDELPDISQSLEIRDEDIRAGEPAKPKGLALELEKPEPSPPPSSPAQRPAPQAPQRSSAPAAAEAQAADRAAAKRVFEAKFKEPNPRLPFYITMGALGVFAVGVVIYFWIQLRPAPALVNKSPTPPTGEQAVAAAPRGPAGPSPMVASAQPAPPAAIPGLPPAGAEPAVAAPTASGQQAPAPAPKPAAATSQTGANAEEARGTRQSRATPRAPRSTEASTGPIRAQAQRPEPKVNPQVASGYEAYQVGDFAAAGADYRQALREEPMNRDALLGLAAVEMQARHYELAEAYYQRLLQADPRDPDAQAGMFALRGQLIDPLVAESRVKTLLASDPQAQVLYFTLGNEYAQQTRWGKARQAYLRALAADPENPDFAYNVAVSLDHLGERPLALEYYRRALALAGKRAANFDAGAARERVQQLSH